MKKEKVLRSINSFFRVKTWALKEIKVIILLGLSWLNYEN